MGTVYLLSPEKSLVELCLFLASFLTVSYPAPCYGFISPSKLPNTNTKKTRVPDFIRKRTSFYSFIQLLLNYLAS